MRAIVVGLGRMGAPIARRLNSSMEVVGFDHGDVRDPAGTIRIARSLAEGCVGVDVLLTALPGAEQITEVLTAALPALHPEALWIDLSSSDPTAGARLHSDAREAGLESLAAPMLGGPAEAAAGTLGFYVAGSDSALRRGRTVLAPLSTAGRILPVSSAPADAYLTKLLGNLLWFGQVVAVTEALQLGHRGGLQPSSLQALLAEGPGRSEFLVRHAPRLLDGDLMTDFGPEGVVEELRGLRDLADEQGLPFALSRLVTEVHEDALTAFGPEPGELLASLWLQRQAGDRLTP